MWNNLINLLKQSRYYFVTSCNVLTMNKLKKIRYSVYIRKLQIQKKKFWRKRTENGVMCWAENELFLRLKAQRKGVV